MKRKTLLLLLAAVSLTFHSCTTAAVRRLDILTDSYEKQGSTLAVAETIKKSEKLYGRQSELLCWADLGTLYHYAGMYDTSLVYLEKAFAVFDELFTRSITNEAAALVTNDNLRPYRSKPYEMIFLHQIASLNYMALGKPDEALVESRRVQLLIDEWTRKDKSDKRMTDDPAFQYMSALAYGQVGDEGNGSVSLYKSIEAVRDYGTAVPKSLEETAVCTFSKIGRDEDIKKLALDSSVSCKDVLPLEPAAKSAEITVVGLLGRGPVLEEEVWWGTWAKGGALVLSHRVGDTSETVIMSAPSVLDAESETFTLKFALPKVKTYSPLVTGMSCSVDGAAFADGETFSDFNRLAERWQSDNQQKEMLRTAVRVISRTIAAEKAKEKLATGNPAVDLLMNIGTDAAAAQLEQADTRGIFLPPQQIQIVRLKTAPGDQVLTVKLDGSNETKTIPVKNLKPGERRWITVSELH